MFGAAAPAAGGFGLAAPAAGGMFGATAPAAGGFGLAPPAAGGMFGAAAPAAGGMFGAAAASAAAPAAGGFGMFGAAAPAAGAFGTQQTHAQTQPQQSVGFLTKDGRPAVYTTKWDELHPSTQEELKQRETLYREARNKCRVLDGNERLKDSVALQKTLEEEASSLSTSLRGLANQLEADKEELSILGQDVRGMLEDTEIAVGTFCRAKLRQENAEYANLPPVLPDEYLKKTALRLETTAAQYQRLVEQLEEVLAPAGNGTLTPTPQAMMAIMANLHDFFLHVGSKVEALHSRTASAKDAHMKARKAVGDYRDPFDEADRKEAAKREAAMIKAPVMPVAAPAAPPAFTGLGTAPAGALPTASLFPGGGLMGASTFDTLGAASAPAPAAGGFGLAAPAAGGMFGAAAPATRGLFGAAAPAAGGFGLAAPAVGGMFGAASAPAPAAGGFGLAAPAAGGMFGAAAPAAGGFGLPAPAAGGTFGAAAPAAGGFGPAPPAAGGIFGAAAPAAGGMFGAAAAPAAGGFGMFGAAAPAAGAFGTQQAAAPKAKKPSGTRGRR
jgi:hypothetical protein